MDVAHAWRCGAGDAESKVARSVTCNPGNDTEFKHSVEHHGRTARNPADLERRLRTRYPRARVFEGISDTFGTARWYAYREGHWVAAQAAPVGDDNASR
ncbi:MAG: hypothetical protein M3N29_10525 [Chloroflexota bacterium]|nr:hypothetical protein [Chloroflexota bacterium]